jgi:hypothetical protein
MTQYIHSQSERVRKVRGGPVWFAPVKRVAMLLVFAGVLLLGTQRAQAQEQAPMDYQVKAAFIINFPKYVDWPEAEFPKTNSPIRVGIIGDDSIADEFSNMIGAGKSVGGHPIVLKRIAREEDVTNDCQILFIGVSERPHTADILQKVKGSGVLTVGDSDDFLQKGGVINLAHQNRKIRLQINLGAAQEQHLKISSRLLMVADVQKGGGQ